MKLLIHVPLNLFLLLFLESIWFKLGAGKFFAKQLEPIGRFTENGEWNIRLIPGLLVYILMAIAIEVFIFRNNSVTDLRSTLLHSFVLGIVVYGVFDLTNRSVLAHYPMSMVLVDMAWGSFMFTAAAFISFQLRSRLSFL